MIVNLIIYGPKRIILNWSRRYKDINVLRSYALKMILEWKNLIKDEKYFNLLFQRLLFHFAFELTFISF